MEHFASRSVTGDITVERVDAIVNAANVAARRRGRRRSDPPCRRARVARRLPGARRLRHRRGQDDPWIPVARPLGDPHRRTGLARRYRQPARAPRPRATGARSPRRTGSAHVGGVPGDLDGGLPLPAGGGRAGRRRRRPVGGDGGGVRPLRVLRRARRRRSTASCWTSPSDGSRAGSCCQSAAGPEDRTRRVANEVVGHRSEHGPFESAAATRSQPR